MSPEQARGLPLDARTDVFSIGVVLYEMLAGRRPFEGPTISDMIVSILERKPPALATYRREIPDTLEWIVSKALRKDRGRTVSNGQRSGHRSPQPKAETRD